ncbi:MAG: histidine kinase, partial [Mucilaginibacter sp.]
WALLSFAYFAWLDRHGLIAPDAHNYMHRVLDYGLWGGVFAWRAVSMGLSDFVVTMLPPILLRFIVFLMRSSNRSLRLERENLNLEVNFLKAQVNPHFLFNTLNNLFSMAQDKENDELADGISKLSGMMRYMIYESNAETVPLKNEVEYIKSCIALNKLRYADHEAIVDFRYSELAPDLFIAPMIFIPFVENAFKHGVTINNTSFIDIAIAVKDKELLFTCVNKNYSFIKKMVDDKSGIGLENVKRRLDLLYPGKHELLIKNDEEKFRVELKINLSE